MSGQHSLGLHNVKFVLWCHKIRPYSLEGMTVFYVVITNNLLVRFANNMQVCHEDELNICCAFLSEGKLITPALRKYPMENFTWIPKGYVTDNWSVPVCLFLNNLRLFVHLFVHYPRRHSCRRAYCVQSLMSVCLSVCPRFKTKTAWATNTKLGTRIYSIAVARHALTQRSKGQGHTVTKTVTARGC